MKLIVAAVLSFLAFGAYATETPVSCEANALSKDGKPLTGAAKAASIKKCKASITATCEAKAVSESGKKLSGAAKKSFIKKCETEARQ